MVLTEYIFNWKTSKISTWKKLEKIVYSHEWDVDSNIRGISAIEGAKRILNKHKVGLKPDELEFVESILK